MSKYINRLRDEDNGKKKTKQDIINYVEDARAVIEEFLKGREKNYAIEIALNELGIPVCFIQVEPHQSGIFGADEKGVFFACVEDNAKVNWGLNEGFSKEEIFEKLQTYRKFSNIEDFVNFICRPQKEILSQ